MGNGLGKTEKEEAGKDCGVGTMMWQEVDLDVQKKPVQIPRKRGREQGPLS